MKGTDKADLRCHRMPRDWSCRFCAVVTTEADLPNECEIKRVSYMGMLETFTSDPLCRLRARCTEKLGEASFFCSRRFSKKVGFLDCAMLPNAIPKSPSLGYPSNSSDTVSTAPKYCCVTVRPPMVTVSRARVPETSPEP